MRNIAEAAKRLQDASAEDIQLIAAHDWDMIREVAAAHVAETARLHTELSRAYRALHGFYHSHVNGKEPNGAMIAYHSLTLGAARRFITDDSIDGASYFEGKPVGVLHEVLAQYKS